jgi:hypothetical protein
MIHYAYLYENTLYSKKKGKIFALFTKNHYLCSVKVNIDYDKSNIS